MAEVADVTEKGNITEKGSVAEVAEVETRHKVICELMRKTKWRNLKQQKDAE